MAASKNARIRLLHIRDEIDGVNNALAGVDFAQYRASYVLRRSVERAVQIISEATKSISPELLARYPEQPWAAIVAIGNILRHEYQTVDDRRMWDIATVHLPRLRPVIARMLDEGK